MPTDNYHHGQLREALVSAGLALARTGGESAVVVREATRRSGVTARAAYRHFADRSSLVEAVGVAALSKMADVIDEHLAQVTETDPVGRAVARLIAVGQGYIEFALTEPGWFDVAFFGLQNMELVQAAESAGAGGSSPYQLLLQSLDDLVELGALTPERRFGADVTCWSVVHGFAVLATRGPLRELDQEKVVAFGMLTAARAIEGVIGAGDYEFE